MKWPADEQRKQRAPGQLEVTNLAKTSFLFCGTTDFIHVFDATVPPNFPFYTDGLSPDATPHSAQCNMMISEM